MAGGDLHPPFIAATLVAIAALQFLVVIAALHFLVQGAAPQCSATEACSDTTDCCSECGFCGNTSSYCGPGCQNGPCAGATAPAPPPGGSGDWSSFVTEAVFESFFPNHIAFYTYEALKAAATAPYLDFGTSGTPDDQKRELAAFLANINHESGGLQYITEQSPTQIYCDPTNALYPCAPGKTYIGRGPIQLSWNYNCGACGGALGKDLLANPDQVAQDSATAFQTALWFWMTRGPHEAILAKSFSGTIRAINGNLECTPDATPDGHQQMLNRVQNYISFCQTLGVDPGTDLEC